MVDTRFPDIKFRLSMRVEAEVYLTNRYGANKIIQQSLVNRNSLNGSIDLSERTYILITAMYDCTKNDRNGFAGAANSSDHPIPASVYSFTNAKKNHTKESSISFDFYN